MSEQQKTVHIHIKSLSRAVEFPVRSAREQARKTKDLVHTAAVLALLRCWIAFSATVPRLHPMDPLVNAAKVKEFFPKSTQRNFLKPENSARTSRRFLQRHF